jgi:hypothetical protein
MLPREDWPPILTIVEVSEVLQIPRDDAYLLFKRPDFPLLIKGKRRGRTVTKRELLKFLEGETA